MAGAARRREGRAVRRVSASMTLFSAFGNVVVMFAGSVVSRMDDGFGSYCLYGFCAVLAAKKSLSWKWRRSCVFT